MIFQGVARRESDSELVAVITRGEDTETPTHHMYDEGELLDTLGDSEQFCDPASAEAASVPADVRVLCDAWNAVRFADGEEPKLGPDYFQVIGSADDYVLDDGRRLGDPEENLSPPDLQVGEHEAEINSPDGFKVVGGP